MKAVETMIKVTTLCVVIINAVSAEVTLDSC
jgi:hypothetical protein